MSKQPQQIVVIGAGAQAKYVCEIFSQSAADDQLCVIASDGSNHMDWPGTYGADYLVGFDQIERLSTAGSADRAIVCIADITQKQLLWDRALKAGYSLISAIHPKAMIATTATIKTGAIINASAVIQPFASIGLGAMIHANVVVEHDCRIGDFANLAPGVSLAGWVQVGKGATIFTGACVIPGCSIGDLAIVGAGATVIKDVPAGVRVIGTPARTV